MFIIYHLFPLSIIFFEYATKNIKSIELSYLIFLSSLTNLHLLFYSYDILNAIVNILKFQKIIDIV